MADFNRKQKEYKIIRWTNVALFWVFWIIETVLAELDGAKANAFAVFISFFIARYFVRMWFNKGNQNKDGLVKFGVTIGIWIGTYVAKVILLAIFLVALG